MVGGLAAVVKWGGSLGLQILLAGVAFWALVEALRLFRGSLSVLWSVLFVAPFALGTYWHLPGVSEPTREESFFGQVLVLFLIGTKSQDIFAYFTGKSFGRVKLAPSISPGKTREGALGGILGSAGMTWLAAVLMMAMTPFHPALYGLALGTGSLGGDLLESWVKRRAGVKDSGSVLPDFGGILDMVDSLIVAAPVSWLCWQVVS